MSTETTRRTNWAGNLVYGSERFVRPASVEEAQEAVRSSQKVRVIGSESAVRAAVGRQALPASRMRARLAEASNIRDTDSR